MQTVTPRQLAILRYIRDSRTANGYSPTMQEIGDHLGLTKVTVFEHVGALEKKGLLLRGAKHSARSLRVSDKFVFPDEQSGSKIPLIGRIAAGSPIEAVQDTETLDLQALFAEGGNTFVLEVRGESMIDDHICDGDYVVCQRRNTARNGEIVVALLPDGEATLKRLYHEPGRIRLQPANADYEPIYTQNVDVQGVVIGLVRKM
ncbi:MAG: transcriptional repressor LexA [Phycisphaerae bacterium]|nr:transcriptional repressor LexA [Phycisphaerae bacterium]